MGEKTMGRTLGSTLGSLCLEGEVARDKRLHKFMVPNGLAGWCAIESNMIEKLMTRSPGEMSINCENIYISI